MKIKQLLLLTIATLCCTTAFASVPTHYDDSIYSGETYLFNDTLLTTEGTFVRTVPRIGGGDSLAEVTLHFISPCKDIEVAYDDSIYEGETYLFLDTLLMLEGTYTRTIPRIANCGDSIIHLTLSWISVPTCEDIEVAYDDSIYFGETYLFIDSLITPADYTPVVVTKTIPRIAGCDSTITLTLYVMQPCKDTTVAYTDSIYVGESYLFNDTLITLNEIDTVTCQRTLLREGTTCDSVIHLTLFSMYRYRRDTLTADTIRQNLCYQEPFTDRLGRTYYPTQDTIVQDTILAARFDTVSPTITTIDSIYVYKLTVWKDVVRDTLRDTVLVDSLPYIWTTTEGKTLFIPAGGFHSDTVRNSLPQQCDSLIHTLDLAIIAHDMIDTIVEDVNLCYGESYTSRSQVVTPVLAGDTSFNDTIPSRMIEPLLMHDSVYHYTLHIWPDVRRDTVKDTILVDLLPYTWTTEEGHEYAIRADGFHSDTVRNSLPQHCDSLIHTLDLAIIDHDTVYVPVQEFTVCYLDVVPTRTQDVTIHQDTAWSEWMPNIPMEPLLIRDSVYQYSVKMSSPYVDSLPALVKDESWLLMINRRSIREDYHIGFTADQVHWYRVVGEVDQYPNGEKNDVFVGTGDYYTNAQKLSGRYYAILDGVDISAYGPCVRIARTVVLNCDQRQSKALRLLPSLVTIGEPMTLSNIDATGESEITILNADGTVMHRFRVSGTDKFQMHANGVPGMYMMHVQNSSQRSTLKYIVKP